MYKLILFLGVCSAFASGKMVGCYYMMYETVDDPQYELLEKGIDASLCNFLIYSFVGIGSNGSILNDNLYGDQPPDQFIHFNAHWKIKPQIKTLAHMAALNDQYSSNYVSILTDPKMRGKIVRNVVKFVKRYSFNGIDLELNYIHAGSGRPNVVKKNLGLLLKALKKEFDKMGLILILSVDTNEATSNLFYDIKEISDNVNFIKLDFNLEEPLYKKEKGSVDHNSPDCHSLDEHPEGMETHVHHVVTHWTGNGAAPDKIILGVTLSGLPSHTFADPQQFYSGAPCTSEGQSSHPADSIICIWPKESDINSLKEKAKYANEMNLGGVVVQSLNQDDVDGNCGEKFPLLKALNQILRNEC